MSDIVLYQFPVSHYCEKVRWALAHKRLPYKTKNMLPGMHMSKMKKMTGQSSVPVLKDGNVPLHNSADILSYLDEQYPRFSLTPESEQDKQKAIEIEAWADREVGPAVRLLCYSVLLEHRDTLIPMFCHEGPWYGKLIMPKVFPKVREALIKMLPINSGSVAAARATLKTVADRFEAEYKQNQTMLESGFSRADLAMAALWAPMFIEGKYGITWPETIPSEIQEFGEEFSAMKVWVDWIYEKYR